MSRISENIRKITKAWGGKTTGNGISDAVRDLAENLPFGTKTEMVDILKEVTVETVMDDGDDYAEMTDNLIFFEEEPVKNVEYTVIFNGEEYKCKAIKDGSDYYLGNESIWGEDYENTGEPFLVEFYDGTLSFYTFNGGSFTISVKGPILKSVDEFSTLGKKKIIYGIEDDDTGTYITSKTAAEMYDLYTKGYTLYLKPIGSSHPPVPAVYQNAQIAFAWFDVDGVFGGTPRLWAHIVIIKSGGNYWDRRLVVLD